jgi:hypothetical protein
MDEISRVLVTAGGKIRAGRCLARSKRTGDQCGAPAEKGKQVCRFHGGRSTGPRTELGKEKIRAALTSHGRETRSARQRRSAKFAEMRGLEEVFFRYTP